MEDETKMKLPKNFGKDVNPLKVKVSSKGKGEINITIPKEKQLKASKNVMTDPVLLKRKRGRPKNGDYSGEQKWRVYKTTVEPKLTEQVRAENEPSELLQTIHEGFSQLNPDNLKKILKDAEDTNSDLNSTVAPSDMSSEIISPEQVQSRGGADLKKELEEMAPKMSAKRQFSALLKRKVVQDKYKSYMPLQKAAEKLEGYLKTKLLQDDLAEQMKLEEENRRIDLAKLDAIKPTLSTKRKEKNLMSFRQEKAEENIWNIEMDRARKKVQNDVRKINQTLKKQKIESDKIWDKAIIKEQARGIIGQAIKNKKIRGQLKEAKDYYNEVKDITKNAIALSNLEKSWNGAEGFANKPVLSSSKKGKKPISFIEMQVGSLPKIKQIRSGKPKPIPIKVDAGTDAGTEMRGRGRPRNSEVKTANADRFQSAGDIPKGLKIYRSNQATGSTQISKNAAKNLKTK